MFLLKMVENIMDITAMDSSGFRTLQRIPK